MYVKTIKYTDYNGVDREEEFCFNLSKAELIKLANSVPGGLATYLERIAKEKDDVEMSKTFYELLEMSVGVKSDDGKRFIKNNEIRDSFMQSEAYSELLMEFLHSDEAAAEFMNRVIPKVD